MERTLYITAIIILLTLVCIKHNDARTYKALASAECKLKQEALVMAGQSIVANEGLILALGVE